MQELGSSSIPQLQIRYKKKKNRLKLNADYTTQTSDHNHEKKAVRTIVLLGEQLGSDSRSLL